MRKSGPLGERYYHYDPAGRLIAESTAGGAYDREYLYLDDLPVAVVADGALYHIDPDHLGTPRLVTNGQGNPVWRWEGGEPFGAQAPEEDPNQTGSRFVLNLRFPGQYHDAETQLHYNHHRDYDPATGRYVESDPIGLDGGINTYAYVGGNPLSLVDPLGLQAALGGLTLGGGATSSGGLLGGLLGGKSGQSQSSSGTGNPDLDAGLGGSGSGSSSSSGSSQSDECPKCTLRFLREVYYGGPTKTCVYTQKGSFGLFTFPQWKDKPCYPVNLKTCMVDTSTMDPALYGK